MGSDTSNQQITPTYTLTLLPDRLAICRLPADAALPAWAMEALNARDAFVSVSRTRDELSVVCEQRYVNSQPWDDSQIGENLQVEADWRAFRVEGPFAFTVIGVLAALASALAAANVSLCAISTFATDYLLVRAPDVARATHALTSAGHHVRSESGA